MHLFKTEFCKYECGEGEIRTRESLRIGGLVNRCTRPLCDLSGLIGSNSRLMNGIGNYP